MTNPYIKVVSDYARLLKEGGSLPLGACPATSHRKPTRGAPTVLIFSPHPDDECIVGALPLRLLRERKLQVLNVAVTQSHRTGSSSGLPS
jgi:hypothetical protein